MMTAEEYLSFQDGYSDLKSDYPKLDRSIKEVIIEFAKMHVKETLKQIQDRVYMNNDVNLVFLANKDSILNAYPLDNIK